jgi:hypothetical protein
MLAHKFVKTLKVCGFYLSLYPFLSLPLFADLIVSFPSGLVACLLFSFILWIDPFSLSDFLRSIGPKHSYFLFGRSFLFSSLSLIFCFPEPSAGHSSKFTGHIREHQAQHLKRSDMDSNQASEQDQFSMVEIHQIDQIDDHRVIRIMQLHQV